MRLDALLAERQLVESRSKAQKLIQAGLVEIYQAGFWRIAQKASVTVNSDVDVRINAEFDDFFVSRAGEKLEGVFVQLEKNPELNSLANAVVGATVLDVGQSTGGFTDCVLRRGAARVVGIEVGQNQLHGKLKDDPRVFCLEGVNARNLSENSVKNYVDDLFDVAVIDLSFISQTLVLPKIIPLLKQGGLLVSLVKPQFEVGKKNIGKGGLVKNPVLYKEVETRITQTLYHYTMNVCLYTESSLLGGDGNKEFFCVSLKA